MKNVKERCVEIMAEVMEVDPSAINDDSDPDNLAEWDSLAHVQLVLALEQVFDIEILPEEGIDELVNFRAIVQFVEGRVKG